jgi:uncharacterized protein YndB with AHSA1/START domain
VNHVEPVRKEVLVEASQERAFRVFTDGVDRWWPRQHHIGKSPLKRSIIEPKLGGRWYATCEDGTECDTGRVLVWEPPGRLVLAWQITASWQYDPSFVTEVEVTFVAEGPKRTRVTLEHRDLHRFGTAVEGLRKQIDAPGGWKLILEQFASTAKETES